MLYVCLCYSIGMRLCAVHGRIQRFFCVVFMLLLLVSAVSAVYAEERCFTDLSVDTEVLEQALKDCEKTINRLEIVLMREEREQERSRHILRLIDREIDVLLLNLSSNNSSIKVLDTEIKDIENRTADVRRRLQVADPAELPVLETELQKHSASLAHKKGERHASVRQSYAFIEQLEDLLEEKRSALQYTSSLEGGIQDRVSAYENRAATIRNKVFGLRGGVALSFEQALKYAEQASEATGVRSAFLLGLIRTESRLGHNIGWATYSNAPMHPTRDVPVYRFIIEKLGYNIEEMPVSQSPGFGWGGAMGPAQFIPSTWACFGGFVNEKTNTCMPITGIIRTNKLYSVGDSGPDVRRLQEFLNKNGFTIAESGSGSPGNETDQYTHMVGRAVVAFQDKYSRRILRQYGYTRGTGVVNPATRNAVNQLNFYSGPWRYDKHRDIVRRHTKSSLPSDPWNSRDAFFASALYLQHLGAAGDECKAARRYYAGNWWYSRVALNYCRGVVSSTRRFERDIAFLRRK